MRKNKAKLVIIKNDGTRTTKIVSPISPLHLYAMMLRQVNAFGDIVVLYSFKGIEPPCYSVTCWGENDYEMDSSSVSALRIGAY